MVGGLASGLLLVRLRVVGARRCSIGAWVSTHYLLRESAVWRDRNTDEVRTAQRHADYAYRLAVDPPAAKEVRLFGLSDWVIDRFTVAPPPPLRAAVASRPGCASGRSACSLAARARAPTCSSSWSIAQRRRRRPHQPRPHHRVPHRDGRHVDDRVRRLELGARRRRRAGGRARPARAARWPRPARCRRRDRADAARPACPRARSASATSPSPTGPTCPPVLEGFDLTIPAGTSLAIVGVNGAGKTTLAKLLCRLYDPQQGSIEIDGVDLRELDLDAWRARVTAVFQDFVRYERSLRANVAPHGAPDDDDHRRAARRRRASTSPTSTPSSPRRTPSGIDLSGGQWQRVALARALCAVRVGAGVVLLDEPTAQLDVRGEAEIFDARARRDPPHHDDPRLAPLLDRAPGRPDLRGRPRPRRRARHARRADGRARPLPHDVRPPGVAVRRESSSTSTARRSCMTRSPDDLPPALCRRCGAR